MGKGGQRGFVKTELPLRNIRKVALQAMRYAAKGNFRPGNLFRQRQSDFKAFFSCRVIRRCQPTTIKEMDLIDVGDAYHGKRGIDDDACAGFFVGFPGGGFGGGFAVFHEAGGQRPEPELRLNGAPTKQYPSLPGGYAADHEPGVFIMDMPATPADVPR